MQSCQKNLSLFYTHIPKCGGNTVVSLLRNLAKKKSLNMYSFVLSANLISNISFLEQIIDNMKLNNKAFNLFTGHVPFSMTNKLFPESFFTVSLRDPVEQLISNYCSQPFNYIKKDFGMSTFIENIESNKYAEWAIANIQIRMIGNNPNFGMPVDEYILETAKFNLANQYDLIGFVDNLAIYFNTLRNLFDLSNETDLIEKLNSTEGYKKFITSEHIAYAHKVQKFDLLFYTWAKKYFNNKTMNCNLKIKLPKTKQRKLFIINKNFQLNT